MAPLEGGPPNTAGVTNLIVFIDMATLGGRPADPHWGDQFAHFHQDNVPIRMTNWLVFVGLMPSGGHPTDPGAASNPAIAIGEMSLEGAESGPAGMAN